MCPCSFSFLCKAVSRRRVVPLVILDTACTGSLRFREGATWHFIFMKTGREEIASQHSLLDVLWCFIDQNQRPSVGEMITASEAERGDGMRLSELPAHCWWGCQESVPSHCFAARSLLDVLVLWRQVGREMGRGLFSAEFGAFWCGRLPLHKGVVREDLWRGREKGMYARLVFSVLSPTRWILFLLLQTSFIDFMFYQRHQGGSEVPSVNSMCPCWPKMSPFHSCPAPCPSSHISP